MRSIESALTACARLVLRFRKLVIVAGLVGAVLSTWYAATNLGINTSTANMISASLPWRQSFIDYRESFPALDRNIAIVIDAPSAAIADRFSAALVEKLQTRSDLFESIFAARSNDFFRRNGLLYLSVPELEQLDDHLARAQPLLGLLHSGLNGTAVIGVVDKVLTSGGSDQAPLASAFYKEVSEAINAAASNQDEPVAWANLMRGDAATQGRARRSVLVQPALDFDVTRPAAEAIDTIHAAIGALVANAFPQVNAKLTGNLVMKYEEMQSVKKGASFAGIASFLLAAFLLYATLRSWKLMTLSTLTLAAGLCGVGAFAALAVGRLNLLSAAFAVTYIGLGTDYIIHVCLRVKELMAQGRHRDDAIVETVGGIGSSLVISAVTTAVAFYAFIPTAFTGVAELGIISGTGMFISVFASLTFLPALLGQFLNEHELAPRKAWLGTLGFRSLTSRPVRVLVGVAIFVAVTFSALPDVTFDSNPLHMRNPDSESMRALKELAAEGQAHLYNMAAIAPNHETALAWAARLRQLDTVKSVTTIDSLVPKNQTDKIPVLEDIALIMGPDFGRVTRTAPAPAKLEQTLHELDAALAQQAEPSSTAQQLHKAVTSLLTKLDSLGDVQRKARLTALDNALVADLPKELGELATALGASPFTVQSLPQPLRERWIGQDNRELVQIAPSEDVSSNDAAARFVNSVRDIVPTATGLPVVYLEASKTVVGAFEKAFLYALIMITVLLWLFLRNAKDMLLVLVPILIATGATMGLAVLFGIPLNFASIIGLPLLVGMNVDNGIHILHRVRTEPGEDGHPFGTSTSLAVLSSNLTTTVSFGTLALSPHLGMASLGQMLTLGLITTLAASMVFLPALLKLKMFR